MDYLAQIKQIYDQLENDRVDAALMNCLRLARSLEDHLNAAIFLREMYPGRRDFIKALLDDTPNLNENAQKFLDTRSHDYWLELHQLDFSWVKDENGEPKNILGDFSLIF